MVVTAGTGGARAEGAGVGNAAAGSSNAPGAAEGAFAGTTDARQTPAAPGALHKALLVVVVLAPLAGIAWAVYELWNQWVDWRDLVLLGSFYAVTTLGISIGFHRMLTHRGFEAPAALRGVLLVLGSMAWEGPPRHWAATHTKHHARSDRDGDPHSPLEGFWHAHLGWLFTRGQRVEPLYYRAFDKDPVVVFVSRTFWLWAALGLLLPAAIGYAFAGWAGAWSGFVWGGLVRVFFNHHVTWSVNSVCHTFGRRPFATRDRSRNEWVVGLLAFGEGWHNNHHAYPQSAVHGLRWYQFDLSGWIIRAMQALRMVRRVHLVPKAKWMADQARRQARRVGEPPRPQAKKTPQKRA